MVIYLTLSVLVVASYFLQDWLSPKPIPVQPGNAHRPDSFARNFKKITMTEEGKPKYTLFARGMVHFKENDVTRLKMPQFSYFSPDSPPWVVRSQRGSIRSQGETIFLTGDVSITRNAAPGIEPIIINTQKLIIKPKIDYAETSEFAELISNRNRVSGIGLSFYFGEHKTIKLFSNVRGTYDDR